MAEPVRGVAFTVDVVLYNPDGTRNTSPTIAAGDFQFLKDSTGSLANMGTLPAHVNGGVVKIEVSATEALCDRLTLVWQDPEATWQSGDLEIDLTRNSIDGARSAKAAGGAADYITFDSGAVATNRYYTGLVAITAGVGIGQIRYISYYNGSDKRAYVNTPWVTNPDSTSEFVVIPCALPIVRGGLAQAGAAASITLDSGASAVDNFFRDMVVRIVAGTGAGQSRRISGYTGSSKVATILINWITNPDSTSVFEIDTGVTERVDQFFAGAIEAAAFNADTDGYGMKIGLNRKTSATAADNYDVIFFKNMVPVASGGVTSPVLDVYKMDGTKLVNNVSWVEIGSTGYYKYSEATNLILPGVDYIARVTATIGGSSRTWAQRISRDD